MGIHILYLALIPVLVLCPTSSLPFLIFLCFFQFQYDSDHKRDFGEKVLLRSIGCGAATPILPEEDSTSEERQAEIRKFVDQAMKWAVVYISTKMSGTCHNIATKWSDAVMDMHQEKNDVRNAAKIKQEEQQRRIESFAART